MVLKDFYANEPVILMTYICSICSIISIWTKCIPLAVISIIISIPIAFKLIANGCESIWLTMDALVIVSFFNCLYLIETSNLSLLCCTWHVIFVEILLLFWQKREHTMFAVLYFVFISTICSCITHFIFGIGALFSTMIFWLAILCMIVLFVRNIHLNKVDLFYITRLPLTLLYYVHQETIFYTKAAPFAGLNSIYVIPDLCGQKAVLVKEEIEKVVRKFEAGKLYLTETHPAMIKSLKRSCPEIQILFDIPGIPFKTRSAFKNIYKTCDSCMVKDKNQCKYSFVTKRKVRLIMFRIRKTKTS